MQDKELVELFKEGSYQAFSELYARYYKQLIRSCKQYLKNESDCEDVVHNIFLHLLENRDSLDSISSFSGYVHTLAKNRILDEFKKFDIHSRFAQYILINSKESTNQTEDAIIDDDYTKLLNELIESLSPRQKKVLQLSRIHGFTYKEIAEQLQISVTTVQEHATLALEKIKKYLIQHTDVHFKTVIIFLMFFS